MKFIKRVIIILILALIIFAGVLIYRGYSLYSMALKNTPIEKTITNIRQKDSFTKLGDTPKIYRDAVVSVEDHRFFSHSGIDIIGICRAIVTNIKTNDLVEGGSTITQQVAKNVFFSQEKKITRKIAEGFMAIQLEKKYDKNEILELYINTCYYGNGYYNIKDAANGYFKKDVQEMSDCECTLLAGVPNAPSAYALNKHLDLAKQRQKQVLRKMVMYGTLTQEESDKILESEKDFKI